MAPRITPERQALIDAAISLVSGGMTRAEAAAQLGVRRNVVCGIIRDRAPHLKWRDKNPWTPERVERLKELAAVNSNTATARIMGVARSVVQRALKRHAPDLKRPLQQAAHRVTRNSMRPADIVKRSVIAKRKYTPPPADAPTGNEVRLLDLGAGMCRYPVSGEGALTMFCGSRDHTDERPPYCPYHAALAYVPMEGRAGAAKAMTAAAWR